MKNVNIEITNVGGLAGKHVLSLKQGLNIVKAGNAVGKTSAQKAIELLALRNQDLKGAKHYANLFGDQKCSVKATGSITCDRKFMVAGNDLCEAGGEPLVDAGKGYVSGICFATPENPLINEMLEGRSIKSFIQRFSDSEHYDLAVAILQEFLKTISSKLSVYRETIAKIEETQKTVDLLNKDKKEIAEKLKKIPTIDISTVMKDMKAFEKAYAEKKQLMNTVSGTKASLNQTKNDIEDYTNALKHMKTELESIQKKYPKMEARLKELSKEIPDVKDEMDTLMRKIDRFEGDLKLIDENKVTRTKFKDNGNLCHACGKPLTADELQKYHDRVESDLVAHRKKHKDSERSLEDLEDEQEDLEKKEQRIGEVQDEIRETTKTLANNEGEKEKLQTKIEKLQKDISFIEARIKELSKNAESFAKYQEKDRLETQLDEKEKTIEQAQKRMKSLREDVVDVDALQKKGDFLASAVVHIKQRREAIVDAVRVRFNGIINDLYKKMGYKNVEDITITRDYAITVTKKDKGKEVENFPLVALSASERVTLGVALLMTAKQEYLPDFPFFVIDEIVTSYDPKRFEQIKDFVKNVTDYVIITQLSKEDGLLVEYGT